MVAAAVRKQKLEKRVMVQSFDFRVLLAMKEAAPELRLSALFGFADRKDLVEASREAGGTPMVSPYYDLATPEQVKKAHAAGLRVFAWTANTAEVWDRLIAAGVDGIITDDPAALIEHLKGKGLR
jgi:glycerophosphoryl diester phosphodiesterase